MKRAARFGGGLTDRGELGNEARQHQGVDAERSNAKDDLGNDHQPGAVRPAEPAAAVAAVATAAVTPGAGEAGLFNLKHTGTPSEGMGGHREMLRAASPPAVKESGRGAAPERYVPMPM